MSMVYEKSSSKSLEDAVLSLKENLKSRGFGVLWELDFKETLENKGLSLKDDYIVFEVCDPKQAEAILHEDTHAGYALPCKMAVRREGEETFIGFSKPSMLFKDFKNPRLDEIATEVENVLKEVVEASL